jgi:hypothetical protein
VRTTDRTPSGSVEDPQPVEGHGALSLGTPEVLAAAARSGSREFAHAVLRLQSTIGNAAVGRMVAERAPRSLQRRVLTADERKNDARELKQAKRRAGMLRRWVERLPDGPLDATPMNKRRARWALLLDGAEPGFTLDGDASARLRALVETPSRPRPEQSPDEARSSEPEEASEPEYSSADFESAEAEGTARALETKFAFKKIVTAREAWTLAEVEALASALDLIPARDTWAVRGAIVVKEPAPGTDEEPDLRGEWDPEGGSDGAARMRLMQSAFDEGILAGVVTHEVGHAISLPRLARIARFERVVRASRRPRLLDHAVIRSFVSKSFAPHVISHMEADNFREYFAEAYAISLTDRASLPEPLIRFFDELQ